MDTTTQSPSSDEIRREKKRLYEKGYRERNRSKINNISLKSYYTRQPTGKKKQYDKEYRQKNKATRNERERRRYHEDLTYRKRVNDKGNARHKKRCETDELYAAKHKLRMCVIISFQRIKQNKPAHTETLLGCTWKEAKAHFERLFEEGMSWKNHGKGPGELPSN